MLYSSYHAQTSKPYSFVDFVIQSRRKKLLWSFSITHSIPLHMKIHTKIPAQMLLMSSIFFKKIFLCCMKMKNVEKKVFVKFDQSSVNSNGSRSLKLLDYWRIEIHQRLRDDLNFSIYYLQSFASLEQ